jgi:hypothetical protein
MSAQQPGIDMAKMAREFTTKEGRKVELIGASVKVQVWIDGKLYRTMAGLQKARAIAADYSRRHHAA